MRHKILLINNDSQHFTQVSEFLRSDDREICSLQIENEKTILSKVKTISPDLILLDLTTLSLENSLNYISELHFDVETSLIPIIIEIFSENIEVLRKSVAAGALDYIRKPYHSMELSVRIESVLHQRDLYKKILRQNEAILEQKEEIWQQKETIEEQKRKTESLLLNILPHHVAMQLKTLGYVRPRNYPKVSVMFTDFEGFTKSCETLTPDEIVTSLHAFFAHFDEIILKHYLEKIKTIGDAYMCAGGIPLRNRSNPIDITLAALQIQNFMHLIRNTEYFLPLPQWKVRIGIHTGNVTAGVVGKIKFAYDIWGDTVNIAQRIETACEPDKVNISGTTYEFIKEFFNCEYRGKIEAKNKGKIDMYYVLGLKSEFVEDKNGIFPNREFEQILNAL